MMRLHKTAGMVAAMGLALMMVSAAWAQDSNTVYITNPGANAEAKFMQQHESLQGALLDEGNFTVLTTGDLATIVSVTNRPMPHSKVCYSVTTEQCQQFGAQWGAEMTLHMKQRKDGVQVSLHHIKTGKAIARIELSPQPDKVDYRSVARELFDAYLGWRASSPTGTVLPQPVEKLQEAPLQARRIVWTWAGVGVTLATGIAAALVSAQAASKEDRFHDLRDQSRTAPQSATQLNDYRQSADDHALAANVLWGVTGAFAAATIVTFCLEYFLPPRDITGSKRLVFAPAVGSDSLAVTMEGRF